MTLGFTVGVWDLFHEGHRSVLDRAADHCDHLLVGVMTDFWVRVQKGHDRPAHSLETRLLAVRQQPRVWKAIPLDTLDMTPYLQVVDVWILGQDQRNMRPFSWPGKQVRLPTTPGISTTILLEGE